MLLGQKRGLEWLGRPVLEFVRQFPDATVTNYAGEMVLLGLKAAHAFEKAAGEDYGAWVGGDFGWMDEVFGWSRPLMREARMALEHARAGVRSP